MALLKSGVVVVVVVGFGQFRDAYVIFMFNQSLSFNGWHRARKYEPVLSLLCKTNSVYCSN